MCNSKESLAFSATLVQRIDLLEHAATRHQVIDDDWSPALDITDYMCGGDLAHIGAPFVHHHQGQV